MKKLIIMLLFLISYAYSMHHNKLPMHTADNHKHPKATSSQSLPLLLPTNSFEKNLEIAFILLQHAKRSRSLRG